MDVDLAQDVELGGQPRVDRANTRSLRTLITGVIGLLLLGVVGVSWALSSPPGSSPDDDFHLASIWCAWGRSASGCEVVIKPPAPESLAVSISTLSRHTSGCFLTLDYQSGRCIYLRDDGTYGDVPARAFPGRANNGLYPGGYYAFARLFVGSDVPRSLFMVRLASYSVCLLLLLVPALLVSPGNRHRLWFYWLVASVPLGIFIYASTNPSGPAICAAAATFASSFAVSTAETPKRAWRAGVIGVLAVLVGLGSRADAKYFCAVALSCGVLAGWTARPTRRARTLLALAPMGAALTAMFLFGGSGTGRIEAVAYQQDPAPIFSNLSNLATLYLGEFATRLGWLDTVMPSVVWGGMALAFGALLVLGMNDLTRGRALAIGLAAASGVAIPLYLLNATKSPVGEFVQPRYMLPLVLTLCGALAVRSGGGSAGIQRAQALIVAALAITAHSIALHANLRRNVTGTDVVDWNLNRNAEWWPIPGSPLALWAAGSIGFAALAIWLAVIITAVDGTTSDQRRS